MKYGEILDHLDDAEDSCRISRKVVRATKAHLVGVIFGRDEAIDALRYLMGRFDEETWQCPACGHAEDTATMDSARRLYRRASVSMARLGLLRRIELWTNE